MRALPEHNAVDRDGDARPRAGVPPRLLLLRRLRGPPQEGRHLPRPGWYCLLPPTHRHPAVPVPPGHAVPSRVPPSEAHTTAGVAAFGAAGVGQDVQRLLPQRSSRPQAERPSEEKETEGPRRDDRQPRWVQFIFYIYFH